MKKLMLYMFMMGAMAMTLSSCVMKQKAVPLTPVNAQINFDMDDLEYLGDVTGSASQSYLLGVFAYGGRKYHSGVLLSQGVSVALPATRGYNNAMYDALMQKPDADFVMPVSFESEIEQQFLGRRENLTIRCKAYKIKNK